MAGHSVAGFAPPLRNGFVSFRAALLLRKQSDIVLVVAFWRALYSEALVRLPPFSSARCSRFFAGRNPVSVRHKSGESHPGMLHIPAFFRGNACWLLRSVAAEPVVWLGAAVEPARMLSAGGTAPLRGHHRAGFRARAAKQCEMPDVSGRRAGNNTGLRLYSGGCHSGPGFTRASGAARFERSSLPLFFKRSRSWQSGGASCLVFRCLVRKRGRS